MAAAASNFPDWDGIPMLLDMQKFEHGHRVWGHSLLSIAIASFILGFTQMRWDWLGRLANRFQKTFSQWSSNISSPTPSWLSGSVGGIVFTGIGFCAQLLHLPCDMVVSGGQGLSDWAIQPWWPFSNAAYVYPMIPWGDVGPTVLLMVGIISIAKLGSQSTRISWITLIALCGYLGLRCCCRAA